MSIRRWIPLACTLVAASLAFGQQPAKKEPPKEAAKPASKEPAKPTPGSLEDTLDKVLRNSPDIIAAEAKVRDAEAELNRARHQVLTKATTLHSDLNVARRMLAFAERALAQHEELMKKGVVGAEGVLASQGLIEKHRGEVEKLETELKSLRGEFAAKSLTRIAFSPDGRLIADYEGVVRVWDSRTGKAVSSDPMEALGHAKPETIQTPMATRVKKLLDQEVDASLNDSSVPEAFNTILEMSGTEVPRRVLALEQAAAFSLKGKMPIGAWFQAIEDSDPEICIVVRDYGLLMTRRDRMPSSAVGVSELWKAKAVKPKEEKK